MPSACQTPGRAWPTQGADVHGPVREVPNLDAGREVEAEAGLVDRAIDTYEPHPVLGDLVRMGQIDGALGGSRDGRAAMSAGLGFHVDGFAAAWADAEAGFDVIGAGAGERDLGGAGGAESGLGRTDRNRQGSLLMLLAPAFQEGAIGRVEVGGWGFGVAGGACGGVGGWRKRGDGHDASAGGAFAVGQALIDVDLEPLSAGAVKADERVVRGRWWSGDGRGWLVAGADLDPRAASGAEDSLAGFTGEGEFLPAATKRLRHREISVGPRAVC